jgi:hypothetical protein
MTQRSNDDLTEERNRLLGEVARLRVSRDTGVPPGLLARGSTEDECRAIADQALAWRTATASPAPRPPTSAVPVSRVGQISKETLGCLSPADQMAFWRQGRLEGIGAPAPPPRRNGEQHRNAPP